MNCQRGEHRYRHVNYAYDECAECGRKRDCISVAQPQNKPRKRNLELTTAQEKDRTTCYACGQHIDPRSHVVDGELCCQNPGCRKFRPVEVAR